MKNSHILTLIMCLLIVVFSFTTAFAESPNFVVQYNEVEQLFTVRGEIAGTNRLMLTVLDPDGEVVYMDAQNDVTGEAEFSIKLGSLVAGEYTFVISSSGTKNDIYTVSYMNTVVTEVDWFDVNYDETSNTFNVTGTAEGINRIMLMVYQPYLYGTSDMCYMDAVNGNNGTFNFSVPMNSGALSGEYTFVISVEGEDNKSGFVHYTVSDNFIVSKDESAFKAEYTLSGNEEIPTVIIAIYKKNADGSKTLYRTDFAATAVDGKVSACIELTDNENVDEYCAAGFLWENIQTMKPLAPMQTK